MIAPSIYKEGSVKNDGTVIGQEIARTLYYSKNMECFATGLKRIKDAVAKRDARLYAKACSGFCHQVYRLFRY